MAVIVLLQQDLRIYDNPALFYAAELSIPIIPIYIQERRMGEASLWWLSKSLKKLTATFNKNNIPFFYYAGKIDNLIKLLENKIPIDFIYWNKLDQSFAVEGLQTKEFYPNLIYGHPILEKQFKTCASLWKFYPNNYFKPIPCLPKPVFKTCHQSSIDLEDFFPLLKLRGFPWWKKLEKIWKIGELAAKKKWNSFKADLLDTYSNDRNFPALKNTSNLSAHLKFGEISVREIYADLQKKDSSEIAQKFINELAWREFSYHLKAHNQKIHEVPINPKFINFPWLQNLKLFNSWKKGQTGYPIVDAGMRQLWATGWMHNRVRMVTASFLVKNLLISWTLGEKWFFNTLVDADPAINPTNWQWVGGCGTDSAPYFRIFNPILQGKKFDPEGEYVRRWIPELKLVDKKFIHEPWLLEKKVKDYPSPIIDLKSSRNLALRAFKSTKKSEV